MIIITLFRWLDIDKMTKISCLHSLLRGSGLTYVEEVTNIVHSSEVFSSYNCNLAEKVFDIFNIQAKSSFILGKSTKNIVYELSHELLNKLRLRILTNNKI